MLGMYAEYKNKSTSAYIVRE